MDFTELIDLAAERLGGAVLFANDEFFAPKENLLKANAPIFIEGKYTDLGKWMDGWETRRRRGPGYDWVIVKLGTPGHIRRVEVDTSYFKGNFPESCSLEACNAVGLDIETLMEPAFSWKTVLPRTKLQAHTRHYFADEILDAGAVSHVRLNILPGGGVSRLRVYGTFGD